MSVRPLEGKLKEVAEIELNEVPSRISEDLNHIREWMTKQSYIKATLEDQWLLSFLRGCKFSLERTKSMIRSFYLTKRLIPEIFANRDLLSPEIQEMLSRGTVLLLPKTAEYIGPRIFIIRSSACTPDKNSVAGIFKLIYMLMEILYKEDDNATVIGTCGVLDFKNAPLAYAAEVTLIVKKIMLCFHNVYPSRVTSFCYVNAPSFIVKAYNMVKQLVMEKMRKRVHFFVGEELGGLYNIIPQSLLPQQYGGEGPSCAIIAAQIKEKVESYREWFLKNEIYNGGAEKSLHEFRETMFVIEGSFRKLNID